MTAHDRLQSAVLSPRTMVSGPAQLKRGRWEEGAIDSRMHLSSHTYTAPSLHPDLQKTRSRYTNPPHRAKAPWQQAVEQTPSPFSSLRLAHHKTPASRSSPPSFQRGMHHRRPLIAQQLSPYTNHNHRGRGCRVPITPKNHPIHGRPSHGIYLMDMSAFNATPQRLKRYLLPNAGSHVAASRRKKASLRAGCHRDDCSTR